MDGLSLDDMYAGEGTSGEPAQGTGKAVTYPHAVGEGCVWVMGDNRANSRDSRWFGAIPVTSVSSRIVAIVWPLDRVRWIP